MTLCSYCRKIRTSGEQILPSAQFSSGIAVAVVGAVKNDCMRRLYGRRSYKQHTRLKIGGDLL